MSVKSNSVTASTGSEVSDDGEWLDIEPDEESLSIVSLLDSKSFPTLEEMLNHCKKEHNFDLTATIRRLHLDFHGAVKLVNFIRNHTKKQQPLPETITQNHIEDDHFLQPVLENDALIISLDEILDQIEGEGDVAASAAGGSGNDLLGRNRELEAELESLQTQFANYRLAVEETLDRRWGDDSEQTQSQPQSQSKPIISGQSNYYFESYAGNEIHETMLKDTVRTDAYRDFIYGNKHLFKDKIVLDIGCGTGILSMFCAKAGAAKVIAVDNSDIIKKAIENVFNNGLSGVITCLRGAIEEVKLPVDQVDIIVSEWMGYCLLYEAMLPSVLYARDKYLKPDGLLVPSSATLWIAPVEDSEYVSDAVSFWRDVYGFDMVAMQEGIFDDARVEAMPKSSVCGEPYPFKILDLHTIQPRDLEFTAAWESSLTREVDDLHGFLIWFDNFFATSRADPMPEAKTTPEMFSQMKQGNVAFTTGPSGEVTHWKQGLLLFPPQADAKNLTLPGNISGKITFAALEENARALMLDASWSIQNGKEKKSSWKLS
ncbi:Ribosomal protein arginine N-methyltransferase rmt3 [Cladobotryum mycophilum]|uniref:type I protein arginine methyltransferase n=1 Tax=Cladobotryum mycophilum TaxID=491253 RepID=A0ABR0SZ58_9HYPO